MMKKNLRISKVLSSCVTVSWQWPLRFADWPLVRLEYRPNIKILNVNLFLNLRPIWSFEEINICPLVIKFCFPVMPQLHCLYDIPREKWFSFTILMPTVMAWSTCISVLVCLDCWRAEGVNIIELKVKPGLHKHIKGVECSKWSP